MSEGTGRPRYVTVGTITSPCGTRGEVNVYPHTDWPERFERLERVLLGAQGVPHPGGEQAVERVRVGHRSVVLKLKGIADRSAAEHLRGQDLLVPVSEVWPLPEGHYYRFDLIGLTALDPGGRELGRLVRIYDGPANDFLAIAGPGPAGAGQAGGAGQETLVPAVKHVVQKVDLLAGTIVIDWPGLRGEAPADAH